jgi:Protein of unknown function (DUF3592)
MEAREGVARGRDFGRFFLVLGFALSVAAVSLVYETRSFVERAVLARGGVVVLDFQSSNKGSTLYPVVKYTGRQGEQRTLRPRQTDLALMPPVGETVDVLYDEANPVHARIDSFRDLYLLPMVLGAIAALLFLRGARTLMRSKAS